MRGHNDIIWSFWPPDNKSPQIGLVVGTLLAKYGTNLDIVFEDKAFPVSNGHTSKYTIGIKQSAIENYLKKSQDDYVLILAGNLPLRCIVENYVGRSSE
jgi:hypothetical protein